MYVCSTSLYHLYDFQMMITKNESTMINVTSRRRFLFNLLKVLHLLSTNVQNILLLEFSIIARHGIVWALFLNFLFLDFFYNCHINLLVFAHCSIRYVFAQSVYIYLQQVSSNSLEMCSVKANYCWTIIITRSQIFYFCYCRFDIW